MTITYRELIVEFKRRLSPLYQEREAMAIAVRAIEQLLNLPRYHHLIEPDGVVESDALPKLERALNQLEKGRPLQYVVGYQYFSGLKIEVEEGVLIPRVESEELVEWALTFLKGRGESPTILDAATGSGAIVAALASRVEGAKLYGCDLSTKALEVAEKNLNRLGFNRVKLFNCNLLEWPIASLKELPPIDLLISNPPYVRESERREMEKNVLEYEPHQALFVPDSDPLLFYRALERIARELVVPGGALFLEINEQFGAELLSLFNSDHFTDVEIKRDLFNKERMVKAIRSFN